MSNGILCFANNNGSINYIKQAVELASRSKKYLNLPVSIVTSTFDKLDIQYHDVFDKIIQIDDSQHNEKRYYDGQQRKTTLNFKNNERHNAFDLSPYDKTLVLDTDYIICNDKFKHSFQTNDNFQIYRHGVDLCSWRNYKEFDYINDKGIPFYWATCFYFTKSQESKIFFDLLRHLYDNWDHYSDVYDLASRNFRNDHLFSMGIHIMNGFQEGDWAKNLPGKMYYTLDRDILCKIKDDSLTFLIQKEKLFNEYILSTVKGMNIHVMNKFSLERSLNV